MRLGPAELGVMYIVCKRKQKFDHYEVQNDCFDRSCDMGICLHSPAKDIRNRNCGAKVFTPYFPTQYAFKHRYWMEEVYLLRRYFDAAGGPNGDGWVYQPQTMLSDETPRPGRNASILPAMLTKPGILIPYGFIISLE